MYYDRLKPFSEPPPTSNIPTRSKPRSFQSTQDRTDTHNHIDGTLNHDDCVSFLPAPSSIFTPMPAVGRTTASITTSRITPITSSAPVRREVTRSPPMFSRSATPEQPSPHEGNDVATHSPTTPYIDIQPLIPENDFLHERQSPPDNITEIVDAAARNLRRTPPADRSTMQLGPNTSTQRKAQPLFTSYLPDTLTGYNSPERKTHKQSGSKINKTPTGKRKTHQQKQQRSPFRITTLLYMRGTFLVANTIQYSTVNKQQQPEFQRGAAFIFKYQVVTSESESQIRLFSPFLTLPDVNIDGVHDVILESNGKLSRMQYHVAQAGCNNITFNESHIPVLQQLENLHNHLQTEFNEAQSELNTLSTIAESFPPPASSLGTSRQRRSIEEDEPHNRTRRLIGADAALAAGTGFILGEPIKDAACNALSIFNLCDSTEDLERELDQVTKQKKTQQQAFQTVQDQNNEKLALLRDEIRLTQDSVERLKEDTYTHISYMLDCIYTLEDAFRCYQLESAYRHFLQSAQLSLSQIGTLYTHFKAFRAAFYAYRNNFFSIVSSFATGHVTPNSYFQCNLPQSYKNWLLKNFGKIAN